MSSHEHLLSIRHSARPIWQQSPHANGQGPIVVRNGEWTDPSLHSSLRRKKWVGGGERSDHKQGLWSQETCVWGHVTLPATKQATLCNWLDLWCFSYSSEKKRCAVSYRVAVTIKWEMTKHQLSFAQVSTGNASVSEIAGQLVSVWLPVNISVSRYCVPTPLTLLVRPHTHLLGWVLASRTAVRRMGSSKLNAEPGLKYYGIERSSRKGF